MSGMMVLTRLPAGHGTPTRADVEAAAAWLRGRAVPTPVLRSAALDRIAGVRLWLKAENLQTTGSYKYRGALCAVDRVAREGRHTGVIAQSTGNHAIAVATAAREYGLSATVVLPSDAPPGKVRRVEEAGAKVILAGVSAEERLAVVAELRERSGDAVIDAYDHPAVVAGQGTATLELVTEAAEHGVTLDAVVLPVGGGGGVAGACLAVEGRGVEVYGVEPVGCDALGRSLEQGERVTVTPAATLADGLRPSTVGELPFRIARGRVAGVVRVDDREIARAVGLILLHTNLAVEPSAAAALAGALRIAGSGAFEDVGVVLTGGNVEPDLLARVLSDHLGRSRAAEAVR